MGGERAAWETVSPEAKDFVKRLLVHDVTQRPSAKEALKHRWLRKLWGSPSVYGVPAKCRLPPSTVQRLQRFATRDVFSQVAIELLTLEVRACCSDNNPVKKKLEHTSAVFNGLQMDCCIAPEASQNISKTTVAIQEMAKAIGELTLALQAMTPAISSMEDTETAQSEDATRKNQNRWEMSQNMLKMTHAIDRMTSEVQVLTRGIQEITQWSSGCAPSGGAQPKRLDADEGMSVEKLHSILTDQHFHLSLKEATRLIPQSSPRQDRLAHSQFVSAFLDMRELVDYLTREELDRVVHFVFAKLDLDGDERIGWSDISTLLAPHIQDADVTAALKDTVCTTDGAEETCIAMESEKYVDIAIDFGEFVAIVFGRELACMLVKGIISRPEAFMSEICNSAKFMRTIDLYDDRTQSWDDDNESALDREAEYFVFHSSLD
ncbi:hypothetical protein CYMTET_38142 [Cymbomonas tetramitiformis]|uniref:EF-hand domain-containing protein n=1 Tax=Cymbomonas tetramitiformis TaxID=36881 RepID=A0AAE0F6V0_9CHLO|nr:hypothetical protein CYMTET_38142 [Cymbomonas tetramitiformis]